MSTPSTEVRLVLVPKIYLKYFIKKDFTKLPDVLTLRRDPKKWVIVTDSNVLNFSVKTTEKDKLTRIISKMTLIHKDGSIVKLEDGVISKKKQLWHCGSTQIQLKKNLSKSKKTVLLEAELAALSDRDDDSPPPAKRPRLEDSPRAAPQDAPQDGMDSDKEEYLGSGRRSGLVTQLWHVDSADDDTLFDLARTDTAYAFRH
ncbi:MAG: hypothetical protein KBD64_05115 [Gammaproteobacteria bacterium]|nr:hypothetical protein [Gammaproteobacteria bacterium]